MGILKGILMTKRFIQTKDLPKTLWCDDSGVMTLPAMLVERWKELLTENNLEEKASEKAEKGFVGGLSKEDTDKHLVWRYTGSCARIILSLLDPQNHLSDVSDAYATIFSGNKVFLADLPSGSGAGSISILTTLAELRKEGVVPRLPLEIVIVAGEISESARDYYDYQLKALKPILEEQAIWVEHESVCWDVLSPMSTVDLTKKLTLKSQNCTTKLLLLSNFTGFLEKERKWKDAQPQFEQIFMHSRDQVSAAIWIEPNQKSVTSFMTRTIDWFQKLFKSLIPLPITNENIDTATNSKCKHPILMGEFRVGLKIMRFDLPERKS